MEQGKQKKKRYDQDSAAQGEKTTTTTCISKALYENSEILRAARLSNNIFFPRRTHKKETPFVPSGCLKNKQTTLY